MVGDGVVADEVEVVIAHVSLERGSSRKGKAGEAEEWM